MSNAVRHDSLLVRYLARELRERLRGGRPAALRLDPDRRLAALETDRASVLFELHPLRGHVRLAPPPAAPQILRFHRKAVVADVRAPADERLLVFEFGGPTTEARPIRRVVVELMTNQLNLLALGDDGRIIAVLRPRDAGGRRLRVGGVYQPPGGVERRGVEEPVGLDEWVALLGGVAAGERARALVGEVAWTSPINAAAILDEADVSAGESALSGGQIHAAGGANDASSGEAGRPQSLAEAHRRYVALASLPGPQPSVLEGGQPYPLPLPGVASTHAASLLDAMAAAAGETSAEEEVRTPGVAPELLERLRARIDQLDRRADALRREREGAAPEAVRLRGKADVLLSRMHTVPKGVGQVELEDFEGGTVRIELDPALSASENATRLYDRAKRRERAAERVPELLAGLAGRRDELVALLERATAGEVGEGEVARVIGGTGPSKGAPPGVAGETLPYRRYRTSGGLEVRVGRGSRSNDDLTFHHSSPGDIWLHARDVAGAHVVLRWAGEGNPPARDLHEAAALAALHSRGRSSGSVPVDWTRRKHVRKPRKAPPGLVLPDRVKTVFVEPSAELERRLREFGT